MLGIFSKKKEIEVSKKLSRISHEIEKEVKPACCILCGKPQTSFCNSHSVPQVVLKKITESGEVLNANVLIGIPFVKCNVGLNKTGTFHYICRKCDNEVFKDYEDEETLAKYPSDKVLAEIALKNIIQMLSKRNYEQGLAYRGEKQGKIEGADILKQIQELDIRDYVEEMNLCQLIIKNGTKNNFHVICWEKLPYRIPIASQSLMALTFDLEGGIINDLFDFSKENKIENLHIAFFPLEKESIVLAFYFRKNRKYENLRKEFERISVKSKLEVLNYLNFQFAENYFFYPPMKKMLKKAKLLRRLSKQLNGVDNLGFVHVWSKNREAKRIRTDQIPNFLEMSIEDFQK